MSEAMLSIVLDLDVERHKRELRESFAAARARLIPAPPPKSALQLLQESMTNILNSNDALDILWGGFGYDSWPSTYPWMR